MSKQSAYFTVPGLSGKHAVKKIKQAVGGLPGVLSVSAGVRDDCVAVDYDSTGTNPQAIGACFRSAGIGAELTENRDHTM